MERCLIWRGTVIGGVYDAIAGQYEIYIVTPQDEVDMVTVDAPHPQSHYASIISNAPISVNIWTTHVSSDKATETLIVGASRIEVDGE